MIRSASSREVISIDATAPMSFSVSFHERRDIPVEDPRAAWQAAADVTGA